MFLKKIYVITLLNITLNNTLRISYLNYNKIGTEGAVKIAKLLRSNISLRKLYLNSNKIGIKGAIFFRFLKL
jgi:hypothetical protein